MELQLDRNDVRRMISMIVERWAGGSLSKSDRQVLDDFMEDEIAPLGDRDLLDRTGTSAGILAWFLTYVEKRILRRCCEPKPAEEGELVCCPS